MVAANSEQEAIEIAKKNPNDWDIPRNFAAVEWSFSAMLLSDEQENPV